MARDKPKDRRADPTTGRYTPTARNLVFTKAMRERRAELVAIAQKQREVKKAKLDAVIARAEAATAVAQAAKRAAQGPNAPTEAAPEGDGPGDGELGAEDSTAEPQPE